MRKDDRLSFRISSDLKKEVEGIAKREGRTVAQVSEAFVRSGVDSYRKMGARALQKWLARDSGTIT
jgi:predicted transcriptional regulator